MRWLRILARAFGKWLKELIAAWIMSVKIFVAVYGLGIGVGIGLMCVSALVSAGIYFYPQLR